MTERRTMVDFAKQMRWLADEAYPASEKIRVVLDNLNTHKPASLYETFEPKEARRIRMDAWSFTTLFKHGPVGSTCRDPEFKMSWPGESCAGVLADEETLSGEIEAPNK